MIFSTSKIDIKVENGKAVFTSNTFVWGVTIDIDGESDVEDNCFDLIPGIPYPVTWKDKTEWPIVMRTGNDLLLK